MANVVINNFSNGTVFVAVVIESGGQMSSSEGWNAVPQGQSRTFFGPDGSCFIRTVDANGNEVPLSPSPSNLLQFPIFNDQAAFFTVFRQSADPTVLTFSVPGLVPPFNHNQFQSDPLPNGWSFQQFFNAGAGNTTFNVQPHS